MLRSSEESSCSPAWGVDNVDAYIRALRVIKEIKSLDDSPKNKETAEKLKRKAERKADRGPGKRPF